MTADQADTAARAMTPEYAHDVATELLIALGKCIGNRDAIQEAISIVVDAYPREWPLIMAATVAWTFAEHVRPDPNPPKKGDHK
ncbi:hypothetical protein [Georgenia muralis]